MKHFFVSPPSKALMTIALCFLITHRPRNRTAWSNWMNDDFVALFHISKGEDGFENWARGVGVVVPGIPTAWGDRSLLDAELSLYREAFKEPTCTHAVLLSETHAPITSAQRAHSIVKKLRGNSAVDYALQPVPDTDFCIASQWKIVSRAAMDAIAKHAEEIESLPPQLQSLVYTARPEVLLKKKKNSNKFRSTVV